MFVKVVYIFIHKEGVNWKELMDKYHKDLAKGLNEEKDEHILLKCLVSLFQKMNIVIPESLKKFEDNSILDNEQREEEKEKGFLNESQLNIYKKIMDNIENKQRNLMFIQWRAGRGKTFLTNQIIKSLK